MIGKFPRLSLATLLVGMTLVAYWPAFQAGFVDFDDSDYVQGNPHVASGVSGENVRWAFTQYHSSNWHPLTWISHMIDVEFFGLDPRGHHAVNVALHAVCAVLLFLLFDYLTNNPGASFALAALFAIHPINVESVAWISQRKSTLSTLFGILAIWGYAVYARRGSRRAYLGSLVLFAASLMSKQTMVTLPFALLLLDFWPLRRKEFDFPTKIAPPRNSSSRNSLSESPITWSVLLRGWWKLLPEKLPFLGVALAAAVVTLIVQQQAINAIEKYPLETRLGNVAISYVAYLGKLLWPIHLAVFYPLYNEEITPQRVLPALVVLAAITALACTFGRRWRYLLVGWFWYLGTMVPVIGLVHVGAQAMADRYAYVSFWGLWIIAVWGTRDLWLASARSHAARSAAIACGVALAVGLGVLTYQQTSKWHDTVTLFEDAAADTKRNWKAHRLLADHYLTRGDHAKSLEHCEQGIACGRELGRLLSTQGRALFETGAREQAVEKLQQAAEFEPDDSLIRTNLGWAHSELGQFDLARDQLARAAALLPDSATPYARQLVLSLWGHALAKSGDPRQAREKFTAALEVAPHDPAVLRGAGEVELQLGDAQRALALFRQADQYGSHDVKSIYLVAQAQAAAGELEAAIAGFESVLQAIPNQPDATLKLTSVLLQLGRREQAISRVKASLAALQQVDHPQAKVFRSRLLTRLGDIAAAQQDVTAAIQHYDQAVSQWPDDYQATNNLAWLLATSGDPATRNGQRAVALAERARKMLARPDRNSLETLAAAYAANAQFEQAVDMAQQAQSLARDAKDQAAADAIERQLKAYRSGQPFVAQ